MMWNIKNTFQTKRKWKCGLSVSVLIHDLVSSQPETECNVVQSQKTPSTGGFSDQPWLKMWNSVSEASLRGNQMELTSIAVTLWMQQEVSEAHGGCCDVCCCCSTQLELWDTVSEPLTLHQLCIYLDNTVNIHPALAEWMHLSLSMAVTVRLRTCSSQR